MTKRPAGWEKNSLSDFLDQAHSSTLGTFQQNKRLWAHLGSINEGFDKLTPHLYNTPDMLSALLYTRSHGAFLAATRLAVATQIKEPRRKRTGYLVEQASLLHVMQLLVLLALLLDIRGDHSFITMLAYGTRKGAV